MFEADIHKFVANESEAIFNELVFVSFEFFSSLLVFTFSLLLLHEQLVIVDTELLDQV